MEDDHSEGGVDKVNLDYERERHWRMVFEDNDAGVYDNNSLLYAKRWYVYRNEK